MNKLITIYTQVYNTQFYISQCIENVLNQTYKNFEWLLVDNGCTDKSSEIMSKYVEKDNRIKFIRLEKNQKGNVRIDITQKYATGDYYTVLDSDDWWELDYLERLVNLAEKTDADIISTGTLMHTEATGQVFARKCDRRLVLDRSQYADALPFYHVFFRAVWGKLIRMETVKTAQNPNFKDVKIPYGGDTLMCFAWLRQANRICLDNSILHHYRIHKKSSSYQYDPRRFFSDVYLYNDAVDFLSAYGPVSAQNKQFLQIVYANALTDTLGVIASARLTPAEKLKECRAIATHPLTVETYRENTDESIMRSRNTLLQVSLQAGTARNVEDDGDLREIMRTLLPRCGGAVTGENLSLFVKDAGLGKALLADDWEELVPLVMDLIVRKQYTKQYDLGQIMCALVPEGSPLAGVADTRFYRQYPQICMLILCGNDSAALEEMTGLLMDGGKGYARELFLRVYLSLAALEGQEAAFVFGKIRLAEEYLRTGQSAACREALDELSEMGLAGHEEVAGLRQALEVAGG